MKVLMIYLCLFAILAIGVMSASLPARDSYPAIISHRGASGYVPEHSLQAYQLAIDLKTDYIEPDLCLSKDGVFVAMHDLLLDDTTNVADIPEFADRFTTYRVEGTNMTGYFVSDFTVAELKSLRLKQRLNYRTSLYDGYFTIPTFTEIMELAQSNYATTNRMVGIYPELKHPSFFKKLGFPMETMFLDALSAGGYAINGPEAHNNLKQIVPVAVQCFDAEPLKVLRPLTSLPLLYLVEAVNQAGNFWTVENFLEVSKFANAIGPDKSVLGKATVEDGLAMMDAAHSAGLLVHPYTFRADSGVVKRCQGDFACENMFYYCCLGLDGIFTEFPDRTREYLDMWSNYTQTLQTTGTTNTMPRCPLVDCSTI